MHTAPCAAGQKSPTPTPPPTWCTPAPPHHADEAVRETAHRVKEAVSETKHRAEEANKKN